DIDNERLLTSFSRLLNYITHTQKRSLHHFQKAEIIHLNHYLSLDMYSKRNLELTETLLKKEKYGSLLWILDKTVTAMGARTLKKWIERPLYNKNLIDNRLKSSLKQVPAIKDVLKNFDSSELNKLNQSIIYPEKLVELLEESIIDNPPISITEGNIIKNGFNDQLDKYREVSKHGKDWIA